MDALMHRRPFLTVNEGMPAGLAADESPLRSPSDRRIDGEGTPEWAWRQWQPLWGAPLTSLDELVPEGRRAVVVAPHPDDEVLGCGGLLSLLVTRHRAGLPPDRAPAPPVELVAVTDGEASHPGSPRWTPQRLAVQRRHERASGLRRLGLHVPVHSLCVPDGHVAAHEDDLVLELCGRLRPDDVLLTSWRLDGHPDHEATGRACARAAVLTGASLVEIPIWAWHWARPGDAAVPWHRMRRLPLNARALRDKRTALAAHRSQLLEDGDHPPVLFAEAVNRLLRPFEFVLAPEAPQ